MDRAGFDQLFDMSDRTVIVTGGLGTSNLPIRFGAPPDWWLIRIGPSSTSR